MPRNLLVLVVDDFPDGRELVAEYLNVKARSLRTRTPEPPAPLLICPACDRRLVYRETILNGVQPLERWDQFDCQFCGTFEYRHRTKKLRRTS
jgi:hypothetical protein